MREARGGGEEAETGQAGIKKWREQANKDENSSVVAEGSGKAVWREDKGSEGQVPPQDKKERTKGFLPIPKLHTLIAFREPLKSMLWEETSVHTGLSWARMVLTFCKVCISQTYEAQEVLGNSAPWRT